MWDMRRAPDGSFLGPAGVAERGESCGLSEIVEEALLSTIDAPVTIHRVFIEICASLNAAAILTDLSFLERERAMPDDWIEVPQTEWKHRLGLSSKEQATARRLLRERGYLEEMRTGLPPRLLFRIDWQSIDRAIREAAGRRVADRPTAMFS
ncbi:hypothetical protein [Paraburkholderia tropica]|uniref:hypothetical protein n=1 Tax=Paraburkholderia tropica TaxID=92647 RepID=UPI002AB6EDD3|nr:hypothetical protein [Paraburkholderia tropica]